MMYGETLRWGGKLCGKLYCRVVHFYLYHKCKYMKYLVIKRYAYYELIEM